MDLHSRRASEFGKAIEDVKGRTAWGQLPKDMHQSVLAPLALRLCTPPDEEIAFTDAATECRRCSASINEMESDLAALGGLKNGVLARVQELTAPPSAVDGDRVERVRFADFFTDALDSEASVDEGLERLREHLHKLIAEGAKIIVE
jgi:hypothetical protein